MKLSVLATQYVAYKQDLGMRFRTEARTLRWFCRTMGDIDIAEATAERDLAFIAGSGPVTRFWHRKHEVLRGFYRFATARAAASPLPRCPRSFPKPRSLFPTSSRRRNCDACSTPSPGVARIGAANCNPTRSGC